MNDEKWMEDCGFFKDPEGRVWYTNKNIDSKEGWTKLTKKEVEEIYKKKNAKISNN